MRNLTTKSLAAVFILVIAACDLIANPGDTTWVTVFNQRKLTAYGNVDTTASFPVNKRHRKIRLHYIIGTYVCPGNPQYCGEWDYTAPVFALPPAKDSVEIARVITPYSKSWIQTGKQHDYVIDVTDYSSVLTGTTGIRYRFEGYSWGFHITLKFEMIEGIPPMDAISVDNIYTGYFTYGSSTNPIENKLVPTVLTYTTPRAFIKNTVTGHGADATGCSEFCNKYYQLLIDNNQLSQNQLWRTDCTVNQEFPQDGTWLFSRGNWCPGAVVNPIYHDLWGATVPNTSFTADINMQPYTTGNPSGGYNFQTQLVSYSAPNHLTDASIEVIVSPTFDHDFRRDNPACINPRIKLKNVGENALNSVVFEYGLTGLVPSTYTWVGTLNFLSETEVEFPPSATVMSQTTSLPFFVRILDVNASGQDENSYNDIYRSMSRPVSVYTGTFVIKTQTNGGTNSATGKNQTSWTLYDETGAIVAQRTLMNNNTTYSDNVNLSTGCYKFVVEDAACDGFSWWYYQYYTQNPGNGSLRFTNPVNFSIIYDVNGDMGCGLTKYFYVGEAPPPPPPDALEEWTKSASVGVYPNPATNEAFLYLTLPNLVSMRYEVTDVTGRMLFTKDLGAVTEATERIDLSNMANGVYLVRVIGNDNISVTKKLVVGD
jgi:hypothetical protein